MAACNHVRSSNPRLEGKCAKCEQPFSVSDPAPAWTPPTRVETVYEVKPNPTPKQATNKLYILGPMTGIEHYNAPAFRDAAQTLRKMGHEVLSPVEFDEAEGFVHEHHEEGTPVDDAEYFGFLRRDLLRILEADVGGGVALDGWEESRGAALEVHVLRSLGKPIYRIDAADPVSVDHPAQLVEVKAPTKYRPPSDETCLETAARLVDGDRNASYGHPYLDFERTAGMWRSAFGWDADAKRVALAMICVKLSRLVQSPDHRDSITDTAGYARAYEAVLAREGVEGFQDLRSTTAPA